MNFWVAEGAGFFEDEGLDVELVVGGGGQALFAGAADVAVMTRATFWSAVGQERPVVAFANLLQNDAINLVVRKEVAQERGLSADMPLAERLQAMEGLKIGVAQGPPPRLDFLFDSVGFDADNHIEKVIIPGPGQNRAFGDARVDAIYAHTPYVETALVDQEGVMLVNQSAGEVPGLANRNIHMLATTQSYAGGNPELLTAFAKAVYNAQQLIHGDPVGTADALRASTVELQAPHALETIIDLYTPAVPRTPELYIEDALREIELLPRNGNVPDLTGVDLTPYLDNSFAQAAIAMLGRPEDCNGDGVVDINDTLCATPETLDDILSAANLIQGDINGDGTVEFPDFLLLSANFGNAGSYVEGNLDLRGDIGFPDFLILSKNFGRSTAVATPVPEPGAGLLASSGLLLLLFGVSTVGGARHRRRPATLGLEGQSLALGVRDVFSELEGCDD